MCTGLAIFCCLISPFVSWYMAPKVVTNVADVRSSIQVAYGIELTDESIQKLGTAKYSFMRSNGDVVDIHDTRYQFALSSDTLFLSDYTE